MYIMLKMLFPRNGTRQECILTVENSTKVSEVKEMASRLLDIPANKQKLLLSGVPMNDNRTLEEYSILNGQLIHVVMLKDKPLKNSSTETSLASGQSTSSSSSDISRHTMNDTQGQCSSEQDQPQKHNVLRKVMHTFFRKYYSESDAQKVLDEFMIRFEESVSSWSLDDLERMSKEYFKEQETKSK